MSEHLQVTAFYKFVALPDVQDLHGKYQKFCQARNIYGIFLIATEGLNATVAGSPQAIQELKDFLTSDPRLNDLEFKDSQTDSSMFDKLRVRIKKEIVTFKQPQVDPTKLVGTYIPPQEWNDLIQDPKTTTIDVRNECEIELGKFKDALNPNTTSFSEFANWALDNLPDKEAPLALYCTGGIRCEKATSYLLSQGYKNVFHLQGGILKYLEQTDPQDSLFQGNCFVFDRRGTVDHNLAAAGPNHQQKKHHEH